MLTYSISLVIITTALTAVYLYLKNILNYWERKAVFNVRSNVFKALYNLYYNPIPLIQYYGDIYKRLDGQKYGGCFTSFQRQFVIRDPQLMKIILIKDFDYFRDRGSVYFNKYDKVTHVLFILPGTLLWRNLRINLTQSFTSSKMRSMLSSINKHADKYTKEMEKLPEVLSNTQDFSLSYALDVIASTSFGLRTKHLASSESEFKRMIQLTALHSFRPLINRIIHEWFPYLRRFILISARPKPIQDFLFGMIHDIKQYRNENNVVNKDAFQILIEMHEKSKHIEDDDNLEKTEGIPAITTEIVAGQIFMFFSAGANPISLTIGTCLLELAMNPKIQKKLQDEIDEHVSSKEEEIDYETLKNMSYLHKVIQETLRKYSSVPIITRICTKNYRLPDSDLIIEKGTEVIIPVGGLFKDEKYFPNPDRFEPERFDNKLHESVFMPFGDGPRTCIGSRFAIMSVKVCVVRFLMHFNFEPTSQTIYPAKFKPNVFFTRLDHPISLKYSTRRR